MIVRPRRLETFEVPYGPRISIRSGMGYLASLGFSIGTRSLDVLHIHYNLSCASCVRVLTPSLRNALCR
jgi:hypothetical protein